MLVSVHDGMRPTPLHQGGQAYSLKTNMRPKSSVSPQDTGDTRETPAINVCHGLLSDSARLCVYDPQVSSDQIYRCVAAANTL